MLKNRSRTEYTLLNTLTGIGGYALNTVLGFLCRIVFTNCLSQHYLGVNGLFINLLGMLSLAELGIGSAIVYALYKPLAEHDEEKIASLVHLYGKAYRIIGAVVALAGLALMPFLDVIIKDQPDIRESIYLLYGINLLNTAGTYFFSYRSSLIVAAQQNYIVSGVSYAVSIVQSLLQMGILLLTKNYLLYLLIQSVGILVNNLVVSHIAVKKFPCIKKKTVQPLPRKERKQIFANVRDLTIYKISGLLVNSTDNILITFFDGLAVTGVASNYTMLVTTLDSLLAMLFNNLTATIGNHNASEAPEKRYDLFRFLNMLNFWIFGWAALGIYFCSTDLVRFFFGEAYVLPYEIPLIMALNFYASGVTNIIRTYKHTMGLFRHGRFIQVFTGIVNIILSVLWGKLWGLFGILAATLVARATTHLWCTPYVVYKYGFQKKVRHYWKTYAKYLLILLLAAAGCKLSFVLVTGSQPVQTLLKILLCSVVTNAVFTVALCRTKEFQKLKERIRQIWLMLKHRT